MKARTMARMPTIKAKKGLVRAKRANGSVPPVKGSKAPTTVLNANYSGQGITNVEKMSDQHGPFTKGRGKMGKKSSHPPKLKPGKKMGKGAQKEIKG